MGNVPVSFGANLIYCISLEEYTGEKLLVIDAPIYRFYFRQKAVRLYTVKPEAQGLYVEWSNLKNMFSTYIDY
jgi:hypothetical protein